MKEIARYAYVFFYSQIHEPNDYFVVSEFEKGKCGTNGDRKRRGRSGSSFHFV
jgi:hypothetical protein